MKQSDSAPVVSVVLPTYDRPTNLIRAVKSVMDQTYGHIELIIIDDASSTPAVEVLADENFECKISYQCIRHERNRGGSAARNTGIEAAKGDFIAFLDDDDEWVPRKLETQVARAQRKDSPEVVYTGVRNVDQDGRTNAVKTRTIEGNVTKEILYRNFIGTFSAVMMNAEVIEQINGVDERFPNWQDWDFYIRLSQHCSFGAVPEPLVVRHNHEAEQISNDFNAKRDHTYPLFIEKHGSTIQEHGHLFERKVRSRLAFELASSALFNERYDELRAHSKAAIRWYPFEPTYYLYWALSLGEGTINVPLQQLKRFIVRWIY